MRILSNPFNERLARSAFFVLFVLASPALAAQPPSATEWQALFNGKNLEGWEVRGDGIWTVLPGGILLGQRHHASTDNPFPSWPVARGAWGSWLYRQAWLYTAREFGEFDLNLEYFIPAEGNSGVSIRDVSRAHYAIGESDQARPDLATPIKSTPAHIGYEIQISNSETDKYPSGSVYTFVAAAPGLQKSGDWNDLSIESRNSGIRVRLNGVIAAEYAGEPGRSKTGPIGLQLHDQFSFAMFRNIRLREATSDAAGVRPPAESAAPPVRFSRLP